MMYGGHFYESRMLDIIDRLKEGVNEWMCHPSADANAMEESFHWGYHGEAELMGITSLAVRKKLEINGIKLISYGDLKRI